MKKVNKMPLGQVAKLERKAADLTAHFDYPYISLEDIDSETGEIKRVKREKPKSSKFLFSDKHVLYGKLRPYLRKVAKPAFKGICSTDIIPILPAPELNRDYLYHFLRTNNITALATKLAVGVNLPRLNPKQLSTFEIPLPTFDSQRRIAKILDAADALRAKRRESLALLDSLIQSTFLDMFGDPVSNPIGWDSRELSEVVNKGTVVTYGIVQAGQEYPGGVPYIRTGDIVNGEINISGLRHTDPEIAAKYERSKVRIGEIVISIRATVGTTAQVPYELDGANLTQGTARISPGEKTIPSFLLYYIRSQGGQSWLHQQIKGATFREITLKRLRQMPILVPPLSLQQRFASIVEAIEKQKTRLKAHLSELDTLFASLQSRAFQGEL